ncbi:MAG: tRNA 2-thiouridine(34) synthase MnmA [Candidatus Krumholzibacteriota bacterium]|nr:tRNA 2-thiouridine(34) synthase MnmA [Candidatus Krumholzibacteriota bacterium]
MNGKKVLVGMSGGVDSSVAAFLLREKGYEVAGITMCIGSGNRERGGRTCCSPRDIKDARRVCEKLGIAHLVTGLAEDMEKKVIEPFIAEYQRGRTPNPCILCNRELKFRIMMDRLSAAGFDRIATGHYASIDCRDNSCFLVRPRDKSKDQTYFLYKLQPERLRKIIFPLKDLYKEEVREIAARAGLPVSRKTESQDICFFPRGGRDEFFRHRKVRAKRGEIVGADGRLLGEHRGIVFYTVGQRRGLGISHPRPLYVLSLDAARNRIVVGEREMLQASSLVARQVNFFTEEREGRARGKIRYGHHPAACSYSRSEEELRVIFDEPQYALTPGQSVVLYQEDRLIGGGVIESGGGGGYA